MPFNFIRTSRTTQPFNKARRTGRTTRQVMMAIKLAEKGAKIIYYCASAREIARVMILATKLLHHHSDTARIGADTIRIGDGHIEFRIFEQARALGRWIVVDHHVIEHELHRILNLCKPSGLTVVGDISLIANEHEDDLKGDSKSLLWDLLSQSQE